MNNPFSAYFDKLYQEKKITKNDEKVILAINALFKERIPSELVNFLNSLAFLVEAIQTEQTIQLFQTWDKEAD